MRLTDFFRKIVTLPPHVVVTKAANKARHAWHARQLRRHDFLRPTYAPAADVPRGELFRYVSIPSLVGADAEQSRGRAAAAEHYLAHEFDLLGSGWVNVRYGTSCAGVATHRHDPGPTISADPDGRWLGGRINAANQAESSAAWLLIQQPYNPIDWQLDFKSGYRWSESTWSREIHYANTPGADIKVPWELARLQHLPQLALATSIPLDRLAREFRNQVLDFVATNPPRFGVNWVCTMDVAIRAANIAMAYDLLRSRGASFDAAFMDVLRRTLFEHGRHIVDHPEWQPGLRSNHYLANIAGLMFVAAYLPVAWCTSAWLALAVQELGREWLLQFQPDGSNFEGSTSYHRLSAEMLVYASAIAEGLPHEKWQSLREYDKAAITGPITLKPAPLTIYPHATHEHGTPFPPSCWDRLVRTRDFTAAVSGERSVHAQVGDNDSGRFVKLWPVWRRIDSSQGRVRYHNLAHHPMPPNASPDIWLERQNRTGHLLASIDALLARPDALDWTVEQHAEASLIRSMANITPAHQRPPIPPIDNPFRFFREFGLYFYRVGALHLALRCGSVGQRGNGGHAHNDQLSILAAVEGTQIFIDPGTYLYTPMPDQRNRFRSTRMHNTVTRENTEQNAWLPGSMGLFSMLRPADGKVIEATPLKWIGEHAGHAGVHRRTVSLTSVGFVVHDFIPGPGAKMLVLQIGNGVNVEPQGAALKLVIKHYTLTLRAIGAGRPDPWQLRDSVFSPAYGWCEDARAIELSFLGAELRWSLSIEAS